MSDQSLEERLEAAREEARGADRRADRLEAWLTEQADKTEVPRHAARDDDTGRYRPLDPHEAHAAHLAELIARRDEAKTAFIARIHPTRPPVSDPLAGLSRTTTHFA
jgi:hypothetical protein